MKTIQFVKWVLIIIGAITTYYMLSLQIQYGVTSKVISEMISPKLHPDAMKKVYMPMTNKLLDTGDITMASIVRVKVADDVSNADVEEAMESIATAESIRSVGMLPLSEMVEIQTNAAGVTKDHPDFKPQRYLKIYQYCSPRTAMIMIDHSDAFSAYLPCRIALIEDKSGQRWLYTLDMDFMIYGGAPLPPALLKKAIEVKRVITAIQKGGAEGDF
ncbi:hypothetical protein BTHERMOSOX_111 [Bathymodiolus thermophilus thioautotrophic gill symbiont]|uniref:DUF302 domain-containing protein n=1 Tax=Bathymodiolus thermophilus thioautotrophic gill symbiont TaxID=2360 RepID=UPI0010B77DD7|nr:DUF302 domain-containing protein [Bathymodiolus thermophilus thioautotrophic gill symbiont]SGZ95802.1 hypothetical protein BTHERMOSOX_111 [Bathymodiolus thermophilus thioautotrophic gill symbiont]